MPMHNVNLYCLLQGQTVEPFQKIRVSTEILDLSWNPTQPNLLVICMSDGRAQLFEVTENLNIVASLPAVVSARSGKLRCSQFSSYSVHSFLVTVFTVF